MLPDAAHLQQEEARYANKRKFSRHDPALPLFTIEDAEQALRLLQAVDFEEPIRLSEIATAKLLPAGHILGAGMIMIEAAGKRVLFSGDLGRPNDPLMRPPIADEKADILVLESTYGDRRHSLADPEAELGEHLLCAAADFLERVREHAEEQRFECLAGAEQTDVGGGRRRQQPA